MSESRDDFIIAFRSALLKKGARQRFSLFFLLAIAVLIFYLDTSSIKVTTYARSIINDGIYRISSISSSPLKFFSYISDKTKQHFLIYSENEQLKKELEKMKAKQFSSEFLLTENRNLKNLINSAETANLEKTLAKVILDKNSPFLKSIIISKGSSSGIKKGMPAVSGSYLIGRVVEVNFLSSRVLLLNDLNSRIPVVVEPSGSQAILSGNGSKEPVLEHLPDQFIPASNATIFTSGKDGFFSAGIPVAKVVIKKNKVVGKLFIDPNQILFVNIILNASEGLQNF